MISPDLMENPHARVTDAELWAIAEELAERCEAPPPTPELQPEQEQ